MAKVKYEKYYFQGTNCIITVPQHFNPDFVKNEIKKLSSTPQRCKVFTETSATGYDHTHIVVSWSKRVKITSRKKWVKFHEAFGGFNLKRISTDDHMIRALAYDASSEHKKATSKVVLDEIGEWEIHIPYHIRCMTFIQMASRWQDILKCPDYVDYISTRMKWARSLYNCSRRIENYQFPSGKPFVWQQYIIDLLAKPTDDRSIVWIYDENGGNGKSKLSNWLLSHTDSFLCNGGAFKDIAFAYDCERTVIFDLPRDSYEYTPYRFMEALKDGRVFSAKYDSALKQFVPPNVIVFANYLPDCVNANAGAPCGRPRISKDQWNLFHLENKILTQKLLKGCPVNIKAPPEQKSEFFPLFGKSGTPVKQKPVPQVSEPLEQKTQEAFLQSLFQTTKCLRKKKGVVTKGVAENRLRQLLNL